MRVEDETGQTVESERVPAAALLPWYVNGSLAVSDRLELEGWLRASVDARRQLQVWQCVAQTALAVTREQAAGSADEAGAWLRIQSALIGAGLSDEVSKSSCTEQRKARFRFSVRALLFGCLGAAAAALVLLFVNAQGVFR